MSSATRLEAANPDAGTGTSSDNILFLSPSQAQDYLTNLNHEQHNYLEYLEALCKELKSLYDGSLNPSVSEAVIYGLSLARVLAALGLSQVGDYAKNLTKTFNDWRITHVTAASELIYSHPDFREQTVAPKGGDTTTVSLKLMAATHAASDQALEGIVGRFLEFNRLLTESSGWWQGTGADQSRQTWDTTLYAQRTNLNRAKTYFLTALNAVREDLDYRDSGERGSEGQDLVRWKIPVARQTNSELHLIHSELDRLLVEAPEPPDFYISLRDVGVAGQYGTAMEDFDSARRGLKNFLNLHDAYLSRISAAYASFQTLTNPQAHPYTANSAGPQAASAAPDTVTDLSPLDANTVGNPAQPAGPGPLDLNRSKVQQAARRYIAAPEGQLERDWSKLRTQGWTDKELDALSKSLTINALSDEQAALNFDQANAQQVVGRQSQLDAQQSLNTYASLIQNSHLSDLDKAEAQMNVWLSLQDSRQSQADALDRLIKYHQLEMQKSELQYAVAQSYGADPAELAAIEKRDLTSFSALNGNPQAQAQVKNLQKQIDHLNNNDHIIPGSNLPFAPTTSLAELNARMKAGDKAEIFLLQPQSMGLLAYRDQSQQALDTLVEPQLKNARQHYEATLDEFNSKKSQFQKDMLDKIDYRTQELQNWWSGANSVEEQQACLQYQASLNDLRQKVQQGADAEAMNQWSQDLLGVMAEQQKAGRYTEFQEMERLRSQACGGDNPEMERAGGQEWFKRDMAVANSPLQSVLNFVTAPIMTVPNAVNSFKTATYPGTDEDLSQGAWLDFALNVGTVFLPPAFKGAKWAKGLVRTESTAALSTEEEALLERQLQYQGYNGNFKELLPFLTRSATNEAEDASWQSIVEATTNPQQRQVILDFLTQRKSPNGSTVSLSQRLDALFGQYGSGQPPANLAMAGANNGNAPLPNEADLWAEAETASNIAFMSGKTPQWLKARLSTEDAHLIEKHVSRTDTQLLRRFRNGEKIPLSSSFNDMATAQKIIEQTISSNPDTIRVWLERVKARKARNPELREETQTLNLYYYGTESIGYGITKSDFLNKSYKRRTMTNVKIVIRFNSDVRGGWSFKTGYPILEGPDEIIPGN